MAIVHKPRGTATRSCPRGGALFRPPVAQQSITGSAEHSHRCNIRLAWCKDSATLLQGRVTATFSVLLLVTKAKGKIGVLLRNCNSCKKVQNAGCGTISYIY
jgi:hypothetical protein